VVRHRLSRAGDRKLNHALYMMAMVQVRRPSAGQAYYQRKLAEGKSPKEALWCLKRRLSDAVYRCLQADQHLQPSPVGPRPASLGQAAAACGSGDSVRPAVQLGYELPYRRQLGLAVADRATASGLGKPLAASQRANCSGVRTSSRSTAV
jgi:hypothetical protein